MKSRAVCLLVMFVLAFNLYAQNDGELKWKIPLGESLLFTPVIDDSGLIYIGTSLSLDDKLFCIDSTGSIQWTFGTNGWAEILYDPVMDKYGNIYFSTYEDGAYFYSLNNTGQENWHLTVDDYGIPVISDDDVIYVGTTYGHFCAISLSGELLWKRQLNKIYDAPAIGPDGTIYAISRAIYSRGSAGYLYAFDRSGRIKWRYETYNTYYTNPCSPVVGADGTIYVRSEDHYLYAINPNGTLKWKFETASQYGSQVVLGSDNTIYFGSGDKNLYALNPDGTEKWRFYSNSIYYSPVVGADGTIYFGADDSYIYALNSNGTEKWRYEASDKIEAAPTLQKDGTLYFCTSDHYLNALQTESYGLAESQCPKINKTLKCNNNYYNADCPKVIFPDNRLYVDDQSSVTLDGSMSQIVGNDIEYKWEVVETPENGVISFTDAATPFTTLLFDNPVWGNYRVSLTIIDHDNGVSSDIINIHYGPVNWVYPSPSEVYASPAIDKEGTVYFGNTSSYTSSVTSQGDLKWHSRNNTQIWSSVSISQHNMLHWGNQSANFFQYDMDGNQMWMFIANGHIYGTAAIGHDGTLYVGTERYFYAINPDGTKKWTYTIKDIFQWDNYIVPSAAIAEDNTIYFGCNDKYLYALNDNGKLKWKFLTDGAIKSSVALGADQTLYFGSNDGYLYALNPDGTLLWKYQTGAKVVSSPVIDVDNTIYVGSADHYLYAINSDGTLKWRYETGDEVLSTPAIGANGKIYFGSSDKNFYALDREGSLLWTFETDSLIHSSPAIHFDGKVYVGSYDGSMYCFQTDSYGLANSPWPKFACNNQNTGKKENRPVAYFHADTTVGTYPLEVSFSDLSAGEITSWQWDFGDGDTSTEQNPVHVYENPDTVDVTLIVSGPAGADTLVREEYIRVVGPCPVANFAADTTRGVYPLTVQFSDSSSGNITSRVWDFGDGQTSSELNPGHTYEYADSFTVTLTVTGPGGADTLSRSNHIIVNETVPVAAFVADSTIGTVPLAVQFSDSSTGVITEWLWDFGDGSTAVDQNPVHVYATADTFTVSLTVGGPGGSNTMMKEDYIISNHPTLIDGEEDRVPTQFALFQNHPNPFNPVTQISFDLPKAEQVELVVYNMNGQQVETLVSGLRPAGHYRVSWNAVSHPSGVYWYRMTAGQYSAVKKMVLVK